MKHFTGWEYLLIDAANHFGLDKLVFEERIKWAKEHLHELESLADQSDKKPLYIKAVQAIRKAQHHVPTGHLVGFDAVCSGIQIMSAITGCMDGAKATGLVDPDVRPDAYTLVTNEMNNILGGTIQISRNDAKKAVMTAFYGSKQTPKAIFGEDTQELNAFYKAVSRVAPGPWELLQVLLDSWQPNALKHSWVLPDNYHAEVKVMQKVEARIEVDELNHSTFTYEFHDNVGSLKGLSNAANVVHSIDAYVLRNIHRRCNYDAVLVKRVANIIWNELEERRAYSNEYEPSVGSEQIQVYVSLFQANKIVDPVIFPHIDFKNVCGIPTDMLYDLHKLATSMLQYAPFPVVTIHDEFKCHPNNMNYLRQTYANILAELAESDVLQNILQQIYKSNGIYVKKSTDLSKFIRNSNYALT